MFLPHVAADAYAWHEARRLFAVALNAVVM